MSVEPCYTLPMVSSSARLGVVLVGVGLAVSGCRSQESQTLGSKGESRFVDALAFAPDGAWTFTAGRKLTRDADAQAIVEAFDAKGKSRWSRQLGKGCSEARLAPLGGGRFLFAGSCPTPIDFGSGPLASSADDYVHATVALVDVERKEPLLWARTLGPKSVSFSDMAVDGALTAVVVGRFEGNPDLGAGPLPRAPANGNRGFLMRIDIATGRTLWANAIATSERSSELDAVVVLSDGEVMVAGRFAGELPFPSGALRPREGQLRDTFVGRYTKDGAPKWGALLPQSNASDLDFQMVVRPTGNAVVALANSKQATIAEIDGATGKTVWERRVTGTGLISEGLMRDPAENVYFAVYASNAIDFGSGPTGSRNDGLSVPHVLKLDSHGTVVASHSYTTGLSTAINALAWHPKRGPIVSRQGTRGPKGQAEHEWLMTDTWVETSLEPLAFPQPKK